MNTRKNTRKTLSTRKTKTTKITTEPVLPYTKFVARKSLSDIWAKLRVPEDETFSLQARRPDDLLVFTLNVTNLIPAKSGTPRLVREDPEQNSAAIIVELPPQHFGEQTFLDATGPEITAIPNDEKFQETNSDPSVADKNTVVSNAEPFGNLPAGKMRMAGPSRLAFSMPDDVTEIPLTYDAILQACKTWPIRLSALAVPEPTGTFAIAQDNDLLQQITQQKSWQQSIEIAQQGIAKQVSVAAVSAITTAAKRISKGSDTVQRKGTVVSAQKHIEQLANQEMQRLQKRYSAMQNPDVGELALTTLLLTATQDFAKRNAKLSVDVFTRNPSIKLILSPHNPPDSFTALELPYRLITSPLPGAHWLHTNEALVKGQQRTELWHTQLSATTHPGKAKTSKIRTIWSPDYKLPDIINVVNNVKPYRMSLDALDREMLVKLMAGYTERQNDSDGEPQNIISPPHHPLYQPKASRAERLILSALGGLLDAEGSWDKDHLPEDVGLEQWRHLTALGRDQYVRVVYRGYLFPFGHSASLIKVTERKFESYKNKLNQRIAILRQRFFIVVRQVEREFDGTGHIHDGRNFPFTNIRIKTRVTPDLKAPDSSAATSAPGYPLFDNPGDSTFKPIPKRTCFWPTVSNNPFEFDISVMDLSGNYTSISMPLLFVGLEANQAKPDNVLAAYNAAPESHRRTDFDGASISYAPLSSDPEAPGDPRLPTSSMLFEGAPNSAAGKLDAQIYPEMQQADIGIRAVRRMLNDPNANLTVNYPQIYKDNGFKPGANGGELFLEASTPFDLAFGENAAKSDSMGAIASPSMGVAGLSRSIGASADPAKVASKEFDPTVFFKDAKILGGISIGDLLPIVLPLGDAPKMLSRELPDRIEASFDWNTQISHSDTDGIFVHTPKLGTITRFSMHGLVNTPINNPNAVTYESNAELEHFKVNLFGFIIIWFDRLKFESKSGSKADVIVDLHPMSPTEDEKPVAFGGPLEFVNQLSEIIPMDGFSDPPNIAVSPSGLTASYSLAIPSIQVGIFALTNMSIGAGFSLPFNSEPMQVRFNFSERQAPFSLTVSLFGGGGFFAIGIGTEGVNEIEAALEFGAAIAIDLGVASGGVEVKAGVYFHWMQESVELAGYVRLHGELSIIGLISASLTFNLQITYEKANGESIVWGEASLIIEVEVLVFSGSVEAHCRREFSGSESDPTFTDLIPDQTTWAAYCGAYAQEEAA